MDCYRGAIANTNTNSGMKTGLLVLTFLCSTLLTFGQSTQEEYPETIEKAASLFTEKNYRASALAYSDAFKQNGWRGTISDRYDAARAWALAGNRDSSFLQLEKVVITSRFFNYDRLESDTSLQSLHADKRWMPLITKVRETKERLYPNLDLNLSEELDSVFDMDTKYRMQLLRVQARLGANSKEVKDLSQLMDRADSSNVLKVSRILDEHGWLGPDIVGANGNQALFLVVQHASLKIQEKYLPLLAKAVQKGKAQPSQLALLTDRIAVRNGKKQIFGSQIQLDPVTNKNGIFPLEDPDHVDERRAKAGLGPLADYVRQWGIAWDVNEYKKSQEKREEKK